MFQIKLYPPGEGVGVGSVVTDLQTGKRCPVNTDLWRAVVTNLNSGAKMVCAAPTQSDVIDMVDKRIGL